jgi:hypothetical protein
LETPIGMETPNLPQRKWFVQEILNVQVIVISFIQSVFNSFKAKKNILQNNIKT